LFRRIRDLFGPGKEPGAVTYRIEELPAILDSRENEVTQVLSEKTRKQRNTIRDLRSALKEMVQDVASKQREEAYHPKLETIAKNTLPLFERAMLSSLTKDLPDEPEEFYHAATESLKGCIKGLSGQGRYLRGVFPEEMKSIREMVDQIGREMNAMTPSIAEAKKNKALLSAVRADLSGLDSAEKEKKRGDGEITQLEEEIDRKEREYTEIRERIKTMKEAVDTGGLQGMREEVEALHMDFVGEERALLADLAVISHVIRKGEKVLGRTMGPASAKDLEVLVDTLAGSGIPAEDQIMSGLSRSLPLIWSMIESGDLTLKNKEEKELFSKGSDLVARVRAGYARREAAHHRFLVKERAYQEIPLLKELSAALKEEERRAGQLEVLKSRLSGITEKNKTLEHEIPGISGRASTGLEALLGHPVSLATKEVS
jgi:predicted  nucleic acid-binding Zn-ribbon protein